MAHMPRKRCSSPDCVQKPPIFLSTKEERLMLVMLAVMFQGEESCWVQLLGIDVITQILLQCRIPVFVFRCLCTRQSELDSRGLTLVSFTQTRPTWTLSRARQVVEQLVSLYIDMQDHGVYYDFPSFTRFLVDPTGQRFFFDFVHFKSMDYTNDGIWSQREDIAKRTSYVLCGITRLVYMHLPVISETSRLPEIDLHEAIIFFAKKPAFSNFKHHAILVLNCFYSRLRQYKNHPMFREVYNNCSAYKMAKQVLDIYDDVPGQTPRRMTLEM